MTDTKEISEAINVQELFEKSKIDFSKEYVKNLQQSYDDGDLSLEELDDLIDSIKTVEKSFKKNKVNSSEIYVISLSQLYSDGELDDDELNDLITKIVLVEEIYENNEIDVSEASIIESAMTFIKDKLTYNELNTLVLVEKEFAVNGIEYSKDGTIYLIKTLEDEITGHNNEEEVTLYRLPNDKGSMLRASVGRDANHEQHYALCRASELTAMYEYNKYAHDLIENTPAAKDFFLAQATMESIALGGNQYGLETSKMIDDAMLQVSPTYAQYGHVSTNPLHRVEETISALSKVLEDNKKDHQFASTTFNFEMNNSGLGEQLARDVKSAPNFYTKYTKTDEKKLVEQLKKRLDPQVGSIMYNKAIQAAAPQKEAAAR